MKKYLLLITSVLSFSAQAYVYDPQVKLDSVIVPNEEKVEMIYNDRYQLTERHINEWYESDNSWRPSAKEYHSYDVNGRLDEAEVHEYIYSEWYFAYKLKYQYTEAGVAEKAVMYSKDSDGELKECGREEYTYNEKGQLVQSLFFEGKDATQADSRTESSYDENGNLATQITYYFDEGEWQYWDTYTFTYDNDILTVDGTKKITKCILSDSEGDTEVFCYYSELGATDISAMAAELARQHVRKAMRDGKLLIESDGVQYHLNGVRAK